MNCVYRGGMVFKNKRVYNFRELFVCNFLSVQYKKVSGND